jgi:hypothetical protein
MNKSSWLNTFLTGAFFIGVITAQAANCNSQSGTSGSPSNFDTNGTWSCGTAPTSNAHNITVSHYVTRTGNLAYEWGTQTITINSGGYLKIVGNLTLKGGNTKVIINSGGTLEVTGTILMETGGVTFDVQNGGTVKVGTLQNNAGSTFTVKSGATATIGTLNVGNDASATFVNNGTTNVSGNASIQGKATNTGTMDVDLDFTVTSSGNASFITSGSLNVDGNASSGKVFQVTPGGYVYIKGNFTANSDETLVVGTDVSPTPYADMVIKGNLLSAGSGDVRVKDNGRLAIFGDFKKTTTNGGILLNVENQGQVFINGNIDMSTPPGGGGGNIVDNQNTADPYGLYVNGTATNATVDTNKANSTVMQTTNPTFYNWIATQPGNPFNAMPITLKYFRTGAEQSNGILLEWATAMEKNFDYFEIQVSNDGSQFQTITTVKGEGESNVLLKYSFLHTSPSSGRNYYRLKSVDIDETFEYSSLVVAYWNGSIGGISVYPNPTINRRVTIEVSDEISDLQKIVLFDQTGTVVWETANTSQMLEIEFPETIKTGVYFISLYTKTGKRNVRVILQ